jgi:hypothetical protein
MKLISTTAQIISIITFLFYGISCLFSNKRILEFERYKLIRFRKLTGALEIAGALGLLVGMVFKPLLLFSSAGLATLMLLGIMARLRIQDPLLAIIPAFVLFSLNLFVFLQEL